MPCEICGYDTHDYQTHTDYGVGISVPQPQGVVWVGENDPLEPPMGPNQPTGVLFSIADHRKGRPVALCGSCIVRMIFQPERAAIHADWLEERGFTEAAQALRKAF